MLNREPTTIPSQIDLPPRVAVQIVSQGIRIRFGRSLVTITGVLLGIAFLSAAWTSQLIRHGVREEDRLRAEAGRMLSFLEAETGPVRDRRIVIYSAGALAAEETKLLEQLQRRRAEVIAGDAATSEALGNAAAVILAGAGPFDAVPWTALASRSVVAPTRSAAARPPQLTARWVPLARQIRPEEQARLEQEQLRERYRLVWILSIALLVTVMGISNAMLMSVTERFREIGTMKCLGARSSFIRRMFLIESGFMGFCGGLAGALLGCLFAIALQAVSYGPALVLASINYLALAGVIGGTLVCGILLSVVAALYPAAVAARMTPAAALRSNV